MVSMLSPHINLVYFHTQVKLADLTEVSCKQIPLSQKCSKRWIGFCVQCKSNVSLAIIHTYIETVPLNKSHKELFGV